MSDFRETAEEHWEYTEGILERMTDCEELPVNLLKYLYLKAMMHGFKHGTEYNKVINNGK